MILRRICSTLFSVALTVGAAAAQTIFTLSPSSVVAGRGVFTLTVLGSNFKDGAEVAWYGALLPTSFVTSGQLTVTVPAYLTSAPGAALVTVINPGGSPSNGATITITATAPNISFVTASPLPAGVLGQAYSQIFAASGGSAPYIWSASGGLPDGLTLNPTTGVLSGTPSASGGFTFSMQVTDANRYVATKDFALTINPPPLIITTAPPLFNGVTGTPYSQTFLASGGRAPYQWSMISGAAPGGLTLDGRSGTLQGTPQTAGVSTFTIQVVDSTDARASRAFSVTVSAPSLSIVTSGALPGGAVGVAYSQPFSVVGGTPPYTWSLTSGNIPGLTFNATQAILSGTPTTPGSFTFTLSTADSASVPATATRTFTIVIASAPLTITTATQLPLGVLGAPYSFRMAATGGVPPYTWSATGLPDGLTIDTSTGAISGTLSAATPAPFAVRVIDADRVSATNQFRINVDLPAAPALTISGLPSTVGPAQQVALQVALDSTYPVTISGQAILTFSPEVGNGDGTIQFAAGGTTSNFTIPAGSKGPVSPSSLAIQTGTVAGQIRISLRLQAGGQDVTPTPAPAFSTHVDQAAPAVQSVSFTRGASQISVQIAGFSTAREVTQATFLFEVTNGQTLPAITVPVDTLFGAWFQAPANNAYGSQFLFTQQFSIQGDASLVIPKSVTLTNRKGSAMATVQ